jgi:hypothetical protein
MPFLNPAICGGKNKEKSAALKGIGNAGFAPTETGL